VQIDLAVAGSERVQQMTSRQLKFWISPLDKEEEFTIEALEIDKTILNIPVPNRPWLKSFSHLRDVEFPHKAGPIDLILGVQYTIFMLKKRCVKVCHSRLWGSGHA